MLSPSLKASSVPNVDHSLDSDAFFLQYLSRQYSLVDESHMVYASQAPVEPCYLYGVSTAILHCLCAYTRYLCLFVSFLCILWYYILYLWFCYFFTLCKYTFSPAPFTHTMCGRNCWRERRSTPICANPIMIDSSI